MVLLSIVGTAQVEDQARDHKWPDSAHGKIVSVVR